jgi:SSS family solute:Na+ symporter
MSAYVKIPMQAMVLLTGILVFTFYVFTKPPMLFNHKYEQRLRNGPDARQYAVLEARFDAAFEARQHAALAASAARAGDRSHAEHALQAFRLRDAAVNAIRSEAVELVKQASGDNEYNDVNYVFPTFVVSQMPPGLIGLIIAAIFAAAMSTIAAELNSLSTATVIDIYRRLLRPEASDSHYLLVSRVATGAWGLLACGVAVYAASLGSLIEVVNRFGSFFYGSLLGVFVLAIGSTRATSNGAFIGLIGGVSAVAFVAFRYPTISFLWHNVVGAVVVTMIGLAVGLVERRPSSSPGHAPL